MYDDQRQIDKKRYKSKKMKSCPKTGKNLKVLNIPKQFGQVSEVTQRNWEIALTFKELFQTHRNRIYFSVEIDRPAAWSKPQFLQTINFKNVENFSLKFFNDHRVPQATR